MKLEDVYWKSKEKDSKLMKVIHDLKTPILSIKQTINTNEIMILLNPLKNESNFEQDEQIFNNVSVHDSKISRSVRKEDDIK